MEGGTLVLLTIIEGFGGIQTKKERGEGNRHKQASQSHCLKNLEVLWDQRCFSIKER